MATTYTLSLAIEADNPIVAEWRHMLAHFIADGRFVTNFGLDANGNLAITVDADLSETVAEHLQLTKV